jgi:hypothetical protein
MNSKIFKLLTENLRASFNLPKYQKIFNSIDENTEIDKLPWTPARYKKFKDTIEQELQLQCDFTGSIKNVVGKLDNQYLSRFFGEIWKPRTDNHTFTGWQIVDEINKLNPSAVLDVGCGYHPFKGRINNLIGIDPYNNCADYMVDILDYKVKPESYDAIIAFGSINFNSYNDIETRFAHCVNLLTKNGKIFMRCNPGIQWSNGPYVEIFAWSFEVANDFAEKYNLKLEAFKQESPSSGRLYIVYQKN